MRLINADKLKEAINSSLNTGRETFSPEIMCEAVDEQPTAFDVEKVTDEILRASCIARPMGWDRKREIIETHTAIEIVKGGGVE